MIIKLVPLVSFLFLVVLTATPLARRNTPPSHPSQLKYAGLDWAVPLADQNREVIDSTLVVYSAPDRTFPLVTISGTFRFGTFIDPPGKEGAVALTAQMLRSGGTRSFAPDTLDMLLDLHAIRAMITATESEFSFSFSFLSEHTDTALFIINEMLCAPSFDTVRLEHARSVAIEQVRNRYATPGPILAHAQQVQLYPGQANARLSSISSLQKLTRNDLIQTYRAACNRHGLIAGVSGDYDKTRIHAWFEQLTATLPDTTRTEFPQIAFAPSVRTLLVHKPISQAYVQMSLPLFQRPHADYFAVAILDMVLGGGSFSSRLNEKIRSDEGLTYSIYSNARSNYFYPSSFYIQFHTKTETALRALDLATLETARIAANGITAQELAHAKRILVDGLPSMFRGADALVTHYIRNEYQGRPIDYYRSFADSVNAITLDDVARVARVYADTANFWVTIVADTTALFATDTLNAYPIRSRTPLLITVPDSLSTLNLQ